MQLTLFLVLDGFGTTEKQLSDRLGKMYTVNGIEEGVEY